MREKDVKFSKEIIRAFCPIGYTFEMMTFPHIYERIKLVLPSNKILFDEFGRETMLGCEVVCTAICHKINWDMLRKSVYEYTKKFPNWLKPGALKDITDNSVECLLAICGETKIRAEERAKMLREIGQFLVGHHIFFTDIFYGQGELRSYEQIIALLQDIKPFSQDMMQKKIRLLIQTLSDYKAFESFKNFYEPTIDYHIIRLFMRRGIIQPVNQAGRDFLALDKIRREQTMATLRKVCADALLEICWITNLDVKEVNRIEWWIGRSVCVKGQPDCFLKEESAKWLKTEFAKCPYADTCRARNGYTDLLMLNEPDYNGTSY